MNIRGSPCPCSVEAIIVVDRGAPQLWKVPVYPPQLGGERYLGGVVDRQLRIAILCFRACVPPKKRSFRMHPAGRGASVGGRPDAAP